MKTLHFYMGHRDLVGGGQLALYYLAWALQDLFDVSLSSDFHPGAEGFEYMEPPRVPWKVGRPEGQPDVFLASSYTECPDPIGKVNMFYTFYPRMAAPPRSYNHIFTLSEYSRKAVKERWGREAYKICGGVFREHYKPSVPKEKVILNSSRFFIEGDANTFWGHSKNQHILIQAFKALAPELAMDAMGGAAADWKLVLAGSVLTGQDGDYLNACRRLAGGDSRIVFYPMMGKESLADLYSKAQIFVHAMGYGRYDPAETEHYGFCVEKAILAGCYTLVHNSGGAPELAHATWNAPEDLTRKLREAMLAMAHPHYESSARGRGLRSLETWRAEVAETFRPWA